MVKDFMVRNKPTLLWKHEMAAHSKLFSFYWLSYGLRTGQACDLIPGDVKWRIPLVNSTELLHTASHKDERVFL